MSKKNKKNKIAVVENAEADIIVQKKIDMLTQMKRDISKLERLSKNISIAKKNALSANAKLEKLLQQKKEIEDKYNL